MKSDACYAVRLHKTSDIIPSSGTEAFDTLHEASFSTVVTSASSDYHRGLNYLAVDVAYDVGRVARDTSQRLCPEGAEDGVRCGIGHLFVSPPFDGRVQLSAGIGQLSVKDAVTCRHIHVRRI